jgi:hypothetical protein
MSITSDTATRPHPGKGDGILWRLMGRELAAAGNCGRFIEDFACEDVEGVLPV